MSRLLLALACSTSLMGCILRDFDYPEPPNVPSSVHGTTESPMGSVRIIDLDGPETEWTFVANVRDANLDQDLTGLLYVNRTPGAPGERPVDDLFIPSIPSGESQDRLNRRAPFTLRREWLSGPDCYVVELLVTSETRGLVPPEPADPTDVGIGVWFVAAKAPSEGREVIAMEECPHYDAEDQ